MTAYAAINTFVACSWISGRERTERIALHASDSFTGKIRADAEQFTAAVPDAAQWAGRALRAPNAVATSGVDIEDRRGVHLWQARNEHADTEGHTG